MEVNKVVYGNNILLDLTSDTISEDNVLKGITFHKANGEQAIGNYSPTPVSDDLTKIINKTITSYSNDSVTSIGPYVFYNCSALTSADFPAATSIGSYAFYNCSVLTSADFPAATSIGSSAFYNCSVLTEVIIRTTSKVCTLSDKNAFTSTPIASGTGYIYVPDDLVSSYKSATNWRTYANQIKGLSELSGGVDERTEESTTFDPEPIGGYQGQ